MLETAFHGPGIHPGHEGRTAFYIEDTIRTIQGRENGGGDDRQQFPADGTGATRFHRLLMRGAGRFHSRRA